MQDFDFYPNLIKFYPSLPKFAGGCGRHWWWRYPSSWRRHVFIEKKTIFFFCPGVYHFEV